MKGFERSLCASQGFISNLNVICVACRTVVNCLLQLLTHLRQGSLTCNTIGCFFLLSLNKTVFHFDRVILGVQFSLLVCNDCPHVAIGHRNFFISLFQPFFLFCVLSVILLRRFQNVLLLRLKLVVLLLEFQIGAIICLIRLFEGLFQFEDLRLKYLATDFCL